LIIDVELVSGGGRGDFWPRPGRTFVASRTHTFEQFAEAINDAFGRWDLAHLHEFTLADGTRIGLPDPEWDDDREVIDAAARSSAASASLSSSPTSSTSATTGGTSARSGRSVPTPSSATASLLPGRSRCSAGASFRTSTAGDGATTTVPADRRRT